MGTCTKIWRAAVREGGASRHHGGAVKGALIRPGRSTVLWHRGIIGGTQGGPYYVALRENLTKVAVRLSDTLTQKTSSLDFANQLLFLLFVSITETLFYNDSFPSRCFYPGSPKLLIHFKCECFGKSFFLLQRPKFTTHTNPDQRYFNWLIKKHDTACKNKHMIRREVVPYKQTFKTRKQHTNVYSTLTIPMHYHITPDKMSHCTDTRTPHRDRGQAVTAEEVETSLRHWLEDGECQRFVALFHAPLGTPTTIDPTTDRERIAFFGAKECPLKPPKWYWMP